MNKTSIFLAVALLTSATVVVAAEPEASDQEAPKKEKKICRTEKMTGSLTRVTRTCLTQRQWDQLADATRRSVGDISRTANEAQQTRANNASPTSGGF